MPACALSPDLIRRAVELHGHWCPGLALGIRAAEWALAELGGSVDEEVVAVVETDMCAVDAVQALVGCTLGKGNLLHRDYGKRAFSFYRRRDGRAARLLARPGALGEAGETLARLQEKRQEGGLTPSEEALWSETRDQASRAILEGDLETLFEVGAPLEPLPAPARIAPSLSCASCGEPVMVGRLLRSEGRDLCIPCARGQGSAS
ncbi:MAG: FmdE family protein [Deferrisomatales bacterium]|nr:FmdE family protein [Deferrisomatales bacterium]